MSKFCTNCKESKPEKNRAICRSCRHLKYVETDPVRYSFQKLRSNARRRNKPFDLTYEEFGEFCYKYDYLDNKGRSATGYTVDRKREEEGYTKGNIQALPNGVNVKKYKKWKECDEENNNYFETVTTRTGVRDHSVPF